MARTNMKRQVDWLREVRRVGVVALLAGVFVLPGCLPAEQYSEVSRSGMEEERTLRSGNDDGDGSFKMASDPIERVRDGESGTETGDGIGFTEAGNTGRTQGTLRMEDDAKILRCVDEAFDLLMAGDAAAAVDVLTEAQTVQFWAQSQRAASVLYWLGQAHERLEEHNAARAAYRKVLRLYPDAVWAKRARKRLTALSAGGAEELIAAR